MTGAVYFGFALVAASAVLLASHWQQWRDLASDAASDRRRAIFLRLQIQRRAVASGLIGVVGAAMTMIDSVPPDATAMTAYLFALVLGGVVILMIALADMRATRRFRDVEQLELLVSELRKVDQPVGTPHSE